MSDDERTREEEAAAAGEVGDFAEWEEEEEEERATQCLFSSAVHPSPTAALQHAADVFGFDLRALYRAHALDFYSAMQCLNYARAIATEMAGGEGGGAAAALAAVAGIARGAQREEKYLIPVLENDPVLFEWEAFVGVADDADALEDDEEAEIKAVAASTAATAAAFAMSGVSVDEAEVSTVAAVDAGPGAGAPPPPPDSAAVLRALAATRAENDALRLQVLEMSQALGVAPSAAADADDAPANIGAGLIAGGGGVSQSTADAPTSKELAGPVKAGAAADTPGRQKTATQVVDDDYFGSYSFFDIHRTMLDDVARTATYRAALEKNPSLVSGKRVVDVGCGTGILSMFAARGGAAAVVGIDGAAQIAGVARANVAHAGLEGTVSIVQGKVEALLESGAIPGAGSFDVLVSEWMGYALLYESMLDTVLAARDTLLKPGGAILPDVATIHVAGFSRNATSLPFWDDVYGFQMPVVQASLLADATRAAVVCPVKGEHVVTTSAEVRSLDLSTMTAADTEFSSAEFLLTARADGRRGDEPDDAVKAGRGEGATGLTQDSAGAGAAGATRGGVEAGTGAGDGPVMCYGVVLWFDTAFSARFCEEEAVVLSTSPYARPTHWSQTMLHFPEPIALTPAAGAGGGVQGAGGVGEGAVGSRGNPAAAIKVRVSMAKCAEEIRARALDISLEFTAVSSGGKEGPHNAKIYQM